MQHDARHGENPDGSASGDPPIRIESVRAIQGPNVYHHRPVLVARLRLGAPTDRETRDVPGFDERLLGLLPGLHDHPCSRGRPGGLVERLREGADFGHITEHVLLELQGLVGGSATYGGTTCAGETGMQQIVVRYHSEAGVRYLLGVAVELVNALVRGEPCEPEPRLEEARRIIAEAELGPSTRGIVEAAERRGIPWRRLDDHSLVQLGHGRRRKLVRAALTQDTGHLAVETASDKELTKALLREAGIPVPRGRRVRSEEEAAAALPELGGRVVVKPLDGNQGRGVSLDLTTVEAVRGALRVAREHAEEVLVEEQLEGSDYRVLVIGGKVVAASERLPCHVTGDGERTIRELVDLANLDPRRGEGHEKPLTRIEVDEVVLEQLARGGLDLESVPSAGQRVLLQRCANLSKGGTARDVTDELHPEVRRACERAARVIGLDICGIDLVAPTVRAPLARGGIVEVNASPGLRMHLHPSEGRARDVGDAVVAMLYPDGAPARVPIVSVTGTNGKTTVTRLIGHVIGATGATVGMTTTDGISIGGEPITRGDDTGPASARAVLADPAVDVAVLEVARGGLLRRGLGYDWSDVAVLTNIREDHIGQDGIESTEDLVRIKSLVAERVREGGALVLNADDAELVRLAESPRLQRIRRRLIYTSLDPRSPVVRRHVAGGGTAFVLDAGWLTERDGRATRRVARVDSIPIALGGAAAFQVRNLLAAVAACRAYGLDPATIREALGSFRSAVHNPGRANLYRLGAGYVMLDYGHNADAIRAAGELASRWGRPATAVVGVPGDRDDRILEDAARAAARAFGRLVVREDRDLRGRRPGEVADLVRWAALREVPELECRIVLDERDALEAELPRVAAGGIAVVFYERLDPLLELLSARGAVAVESVEATAARAS